MSNDKPKPTIAELEAILNDPTEMDLEIMPNGEVRAVPKGTAEKHEVKVITSRYAVQEFY